jgi:acetate kinase
MLVERNSEGRVMHEYALVLNAGSSSLKFCVFRRPERQGWEIASRGQIEGIGTSPRFSAKDAAGEALANAPLGSNVHDARGALQTLADWLQATYGKAKLLGVGHRVVHGGRAFSKPVVVTPQLLEDLKVLIPLAPLHQPYNLAAIEAIFERLPEVPQVACFDTSFHVTGTPVAKLVPFPADLRCKGLQRYGFHGLSYEYVASALSEVAPDIAKGRVVVAHLGSGASMCALRDGKSVDNSLGFTALDGLCMGTRPGALDPGIVLYLFQTFGLSAKEVENILYKKSGLLGISGISNDMRNLLCSEKPEALLAVDYFVYRAAKEIGALSAVLGGIDALVFTAGIGENSPEIRMRICEASSWLGIELDTEANNGKASRISKACSKVSVWVIPTNEELMIARHTGAMLGLT